MPPTRSHGSRRRSEAAARIGRPQALRELAAQHAALRALIARCQDLADELDAGRIEAAPLVDAVGALRRAFDAHNQLEEQLLRPVLLSTGRLGAVQIGRMAHDHTEAHRAMRRGLEPTASSPLRDVLDSLCAHLDAEDRYFAIPDGAPGDAAR